MLKWAFGLPDTWGATPEKGLMIAIENEFDWIGTVTRTSAEQTRATREDEIDHRAFLLAKLGYPKKVAEQRLKANLAWEYERLGKAKTAKRVVALVGAAYKRAGVVKKKK